jgi:hypothetical protein
MALTCRVEEPSTASKADSKSGISQRPQEAMSPKCHVRRRLVGNEGSRLAQKWMTKSLAAMTAQFLDGGIPALTLPLKASAFSER